VTRFLTRKLPPHWLYVPSKRRLRKVLDRLDVDRSVVRFGGTGYRESPQRITLGFLESRVVENRWCFYLGLRGIPESVVGDLQDELSAVAVDEIDRYIRSCFHQPHPAGVNPSQFYLNFRAEDGRVHAECYQKAISRYSYSTGEWWKD
jgi:hypothetical protein